MHVSEHLELAAWIALHARPLRAVAQPIRPAAIERYWKAGKCRLDRWLRVLRDAELTHLVDPHARAKLVGVMEEILLGEPLARVWTAWVELLDKALGQEEAGPVVRNVHLAQQEARRRALALLVNGPALSAEESVEVNRCRRKGEHWTDLLIGHLCLAGDVSADAFSPERARDFARDLVEQPAENDAAATALLLSSLRSACQPRLAAEGPNRDLNADLAAAVVGSLPVEAFDSLGWPRSLQLGRMLAFVDDTQGMVDALFREPLLRTRRDDLPHATPGRFRLGEA